MLGLLGNEPQKVSLFYFGESHLPEKWDEMKPDVDLGELGEGCRVYVVKAIRIRLGLC